MLYVPLSKQLVDPGISTKGSQITVCEQYDLFLTQGGELFYHWQGAGELVPISENALIGISHQDNEIFYICQTGEETSLMSFIVSEEQHNTLHLLDNTILPQLTSDADYAFMLNEQGVVYRYDIQNGDLIPYTFIDMETVKAPMISIFDYRLMVYDLFKEPDASFCYSIPGDSILTQDEIEQNMEREAELSADASDQQQFPEYSYLSMGSLGEPVTLLQNQLCQLGYLPFEPTGFYGVETMHAVSLAQSEMSLVENGNANRFFQSMLNTASDGFQFLPFSLGDVGTRISDVKSRLITLGYMVVTPDNVCDNSMLEAIEQYCAQTGKTYDSVISEELQRNILAKDAVPYDGFLTLKENDICESSIALNARLKSLGYSSYSARPYIDKNSIDAIKLFTEINHVPFDGVITVQIQESVFSDSAISCPEEVRPKELTDASSATSGQVITDKELKILRKWLTKSFAVNHTDRQAVKRLQVRLNHLGYLPTENITMIYDEKTADAIRRFQKDQGLSEDGIPSKRTLMAVFSILNSTLSGDE